MPLLLPLPAALGRSAICRAFLWQCERDVLHELPFTAERLELLERPRVGFRSPVGQQIRGQQLPRKRLRERRHGLRRTRHVARHVGRGKLLFCDRIDRLAVGPIEKEQKTVLRCLGHGFDGATAAADRHKTRGRWRIAIPEIVMHELEMPEPLTRRGVECKQRVREEIVTDPIGSVEISRG